MPRAECPAVRSNDMSFGSFLISPASRQPLPFHSLVLILTPASPACHRGLSRACWHMARCLCPCSPCGMAQRPPSLSIGDAVACLPARPPFARIARSFTARRRRAGQIAWWLLQVAFSLWPDSDSRIGARGGYGRPRPFQACHPCKPMQPARNHHHLDHSAHHEIGRPLIHANHALGSASSNRRGRGAATRPEPRRQGGPKDCWDVTDHVAAPTVADQRRTRLGTDLGGACRAGKAGPWFETCS